MGQDKAGLPFGPETMIVRVLRLVGEVAGDVVVTAAAGQSVPAGCRVEWDRAADEGPLPGLLNAATGLDTDYVFVVACDSPLLQPRVLALLASLVEGWDGAVPVVGGRRIPTCAIYRRSALLDARAAFGPPRHRSLQSYLSGLRIRDVEEATVRTVDPALLSVRPCNTPEEYREALRQAGIPVTVAGQPAG